MNKIPLFQIDTFTDEPFRGNPAAVCLLDRQISPELMLSIAMETKASETAFLLPTEDRFHLRWFSQTQEIDLCGHGTLASAHLLWEQGILSKDAPALFDTRSGLLTVIFKDEWLEMDLPAASFSPVTLPEELVQILNIDPVNAVYAQDRYIIELRTEADVKNANPDIKALTKFDPVVLTSLGSAQSYYDFVSRTFAPSVGIDEDPVTGSSHCSLTPYYAEKLKRNSFHSCQLSKRTGQLKVLLAGTRVFISGKAVTVFDGNLVF
jgi:PhzF family phenazine biosynthesis protein